MFNLFAGWINTDGSFGFQNLLIDNHIKINFKKLFFLESFAFHFDFS